MSASDNQFTGTWLDAGKQRGTQFSHHARDYDHPGDEVDTKPMRHAHIEQNGQQIAVWVPAEWSDDQVREALESNW